MNKNKIFQFRLSEVELALLYAKAHAEQMSASEYLRWLIRHIA